MMKRMVITVAFLAAVGAIAQSVPFQASLTPDIAIHSSSTYVEGLVLSIWGENPQRALALAIANGSTGASAGFTWSWLVNYSDDYKGVQWAAVNYSKGDILGWQAAFINYSEGYTKGLQTGWVNYAGEMKGLQLGLVNYAARTDTAVQIGLLNMMPSTTGWFTDVPDKLAPGMVIVNWSF